MLSFETSLVELKSRRAQFEIQQLGLRRRLGELEREQSRVEDARRRGESDSLAVQEVRDRRVEVDCEVERLERVICDLDVRITLAEQGDVEQGIHHLTTASQEASGELDRLRTEILETLRSLAAPLERYQQLAEHQRSLSGRIREATGKDNSYAAYLDTALLRASDYDDQLQQVVEVIRRTRVVA